MVSFAAGSPQLKELKVEAVKTAQVPFDEVVSSGKIEANPNLLSRVALPLAGRVAAVLVRVGDTVKRGDPLLTLESPDADAAVGAWLQAQAAITQAKAAMTQAKANLNKAQADSDRATDLFQHNAVAKKDVLAAENALALAKASVEQSQAALDQGQAAL